MTPSGSTKLPLKEVCLFLATATAFSWPIMILAWRAIPSDFTPGDIEALEQAFGSWLMLFGAGPMLSAILVTAWFRGRAGMNKLLSRVIRFRVKPQWFLVALALPLAYQWLALWIWGLTTGVSIDYPELGPYLISWLQIAVISSLYFITEELGWRGFMLPRAMATYSWLKASLIVGVIWAVWHYPFWLTASWGVTGSWSQAISMTLSSTLFAISLSVLITWIFKNTNGSVLIAMIFHGSNNANMDKVFAAGGEQTQGIGFLLSRSLVAALFAVAIYYFSKKERVSNVDSQIDE